MAESDSLIPASQIDSTPYGACAGVALVVIVLFSLAATGLWRAASWTKRHGWNIDFNMPSSPSTSASQSAQQALDAAKQAAGEQVKQAATQAVQSAADSAKQAAQNQVNQAAADVGKKLQDALNP